MRAIKLLSFLTFVGFVGCAGQEAVVGDDDPGGGNGSGSDAPPRIKQPPQPKSGSLTAPGCDAIPERGKCEDGVAVFCDIDLKVVADPDDNSGVLRRKDCKALGKSCLVDAQLGAVCDTPPAAAPGATSPCDTGITVEGDCFGTTAIWCDEKTKQTQVWECTADNMVCDFDDVGAFCFAPKGSPAPVTLTAAECADLNGFVGKCVEGTTDDENLFNTARWCTDDNVVHEQACTGHESCNFTCAGVNGAACCPTTECAQIGERGFCSIHTGSGVQGNPRYCENGVIHEDTCKKGLVCQIDGACGDGAQCCAP